MYFSNADITVFPLIPPLVAFFVSFLTSLTGISGAFLLLPFQISYLGYTHPSVSATNQVFNIVATPSGIFRLYQEKRLLWPLALIITSGTLPGVFLGALVRLTWLPDPTVFQYFAGIILFSLGIRLFLHSLKAYKEKTEDKQKYSTKEAVKEAEQEQISHVQFSWRKLVYHYEGKEMVSSCPLLFLLSIFIGCLGGAYGIGCGTLISPFLVMFFRLPIHTTAGATLFATCMTSLAGAICYTLLAPYYPHLAVRPDWLLGFLFGLGGFFGIYLGARCQKFLPERSIQLGLSLVLFFIGYRYLFS